MFKKILYYSGINYFYRKFIQKPHLLCLGYHSIRPKGSTITSYAHLVVDTDSFKTQLGYLEKERYKFISIKDLLEMKSIEQNCVLVYFDDGFKDVLNFAMPILAEKGIRPTIFITTDYIEGGSNPWKEQNPFMSWKDVKTYGSLADFQSHTVSHRKLVNLSIECARKELRSSKKIIEDNTGCEVFAISYPHSRFNKEIQELVLELDYKVSIGNGRGVNYHSVIFSKKIPMWPNDKLTDFKLYTGIFYGLHSGN